MLSEVNEKMMEVEDEKGRIKEVMELLVAGKALIIAGSDEELQVS